MRGVVRKWDDSRGFGFIKEDSGRDVFVHYTQVQGEGFKTLVVGEKVEFELYEATKGYEAKGVSRVTS